jgi:hypothetical protein
MQKRKNGTITRPATRGGLCDVSCAQGGAIPEGSYAIILGGLTNPSRTDYKHTIRSAAQLKLFKQPSKPKNEDLLHF